MSKNVIHTIRDFTFGIDERAVLRHQGYKPSSRVSPQARRLLDEALASARDLARPAGVWTIREILSRAHDDEVSLEGGFSIESKQVARLLTGCVEVALFVVTIGFDVEKESAGLIKGGDGAPGLMLDCAASEAVEGCADHVNKLIQGNAHRRGLHLTPRFSPGYGDWPLERQKELFRLMEPAQIGVLLTESCMMQPRKSVSAILGLGPLDGIRVGASPCKSCAP